MGVLKNTFIVFVAAWLAVAFCSEPQSEDMWGLKLNHSTIGWLASEPDLAGSVLEFTNPINGGLAFSVQAAIFE